MNEPKIFERDADWIEWARENKKRADRLASAARIVWEARDTTKECPELSTLCFALLDYEDRVG
jgi:hypothetical protein